jgi:hypothetical protein
MPLDSERHRILRTLDVEAVRKEFVETVGQPVQDDTILASLHKARIYAGRAFSRAERERSASWLIEHGYEVPGA